MFVAPSPVTELKVTSRSSHWLELTWNEPQFPNGNITHYIVTWTEQPANFSLYHQYNFCINSKYLTHILFIFTCGKCYEEILTI